MNKTKRGGGGDATPIHSALPGLHQYNSTNGDQVCRAFGHIFAKLQPIDGHSQVPSQVSQVFFSLGGSKNHSSLFFLGLAELCRLKFLLRNKTNDKDVDDLELHS